MKSKVEINGVKVETLVDEFVNANILEAEAGTTGKMGGDKGHGCRTYFRIKDLSSTYLECNIRNNGKAYEFHNVGEVELMLGGDSELETFIEALRFALSTLEAQADLMPIEPKFANEDAATLLMLISDAISGKYGGMTSDMRCRLSSIKDKLNHKYEL